MISAIWLYNTSGIGIHVTGDAQGITLASCVENSPEETATAFIQLDAGSSAAIINPQNQTANVLNGNYFFVNQNGEMSVSGSGGTFLGATSIFGDALIDAPLIMGGAIAMGGFKVTGLANGTASADAAAFGQLPVADTTVTDIQPVGVQAAGSSGKWADAKHVHGYSGAEPLASGEAVYARGLAQNSITLITGTLFLRYWTAATSGTSTEVIGGRRDGSQRADLRRCRHLQRQRQQREPDSADQHREPQLHAVEEHVHQLHAELAGQFLAGGRDYLCPGLSCGWHHSSRARRLLGHRGVHGSQPDHLRNYCRIHHAVLGHREQHHGRLPRRARRRGTVTVGEALLTGEEIITALNPRVAAKPYSSLQSESSG